jgi:flagellar protein FlgJ
MTSPAGLADVYTDFTGTQQLRNQAKRDPKAALKETSQQFESVFIQMALKSMRKASPKSGLTNSQQAETYRDMYDQQLAVEMGKRAQFGVANLLNRQLGGNNTQAQGLNGKGLAEYRQAAFQRPVGMALPGKERTLHVAGGSEAASEAASTAAARDGSGPFASRAEFLETLWPHAQKAAAEIGVDPKLLLAQAALETGWGKSLSNGNNLFGIKADRRWSGDKSTVGTTEFVGGVAVREQASFRNYGSYGDSFRDYVSFLKENPRYQNALANADNPRQFIAGLQKAGYATDPAYARKVLSIYENNDTLEKLV